MSEKNSLVEEALIQMKQVEEAISENAKGILASTMKEEIGQLVKESLSEQDDEEDVDTEVETDTEEPEDVDTDNEDDVEMDVDMEDMPAMDDTDMEMDMDTDSEETPIDLTHITDDSKLLKVFQAMGEEDGIIVVKDGANVNLTDKNTDKEYMIKMGESKEYKKRQIMEYAEDDSDLDDVIDSLFDSDSDMTSDYEDESSMTDEMEETIYEIQMDDDSLEETDDSLEETDDSLEETIYEIQMDDDSMEGEYESDSMEEEYESDSMEESWEEDESYHMDESYSHKKAKKGIKPKGVGMGSPKFSYKKTSGGFKESMKQGTKGVGMGKAKFEYKEGKNLEGKNKVVKKSETKEAARTLASGKAWGRKGLSKPRTSPRHLKLESMEDEITMLRQKNDEYRKALNTFREKLNEVAIFNSNLAYATRLFTEHSTTKKEKINILRRFDDVETLKESKNLYKSIKDELAKEGTQTMNESVERKINKTVSTGSSTSLIESKTYENPQFLRIKDLMGKIV